MYYMNARYYDPDTGRFISQDTYRGEDEDAGTWHLYAYCANNPVNYTDPSGHDAIILQSNFVAEKVGHTAILIQHGKNWKCFSWGGKGYKSKYINWDAEVRSVKNKKVYKAINIRFHRNKKSEKYTRYLYIKGNFKGSLKYIKKVKSGDSYKKYNIAGCNCVWMALEVLQHGKISKKKYDTIEDWQWGYIYNATTRKRERRKATLVPNNVFVD